MCLLPPEVTHAKFFDFRLDLLMKEENRKMPFPPHVDSNANSFYFPFKHLKDFLLLFTKGLREVTTMVYILLHK